MVELKLTPNRISALVVAIIAAVFFLSMLVLALIDHYKIKNKDITNNKAINYDQSFAYLKKDGIVKCVNTKSFRMPTNKSVNEFLKTFLNHNHDLISQWLDNFILQPMDDNEDDRRTVIDVDYILSSNKKHTKFKICKCALYCTQVDLEKQIVYFELELFPNTKTSYSKNRTIKQFLYTDDVIKKRYEAGKFSKGCFMCIDLSNKPNTAPIYNELLIKYLIIDTIYKITSPLDTKICLKGQYDRICLLETRSVNTFDLTKYVTTIKNLISNLLEVRGFSLYYDFYIVASLTSDLDRSFEESYKKVEKLFTIDQNLGRNFSIYQENKNDHFKVEESYKNEVQRIIRNSAINISFRPIVHIANKRIVNSGYMSFVQPDNSLFKDIDELRRICEVYEKDKELFSLILRKTIPIFTSEKDNTQQKLALSMNIKDIPYAIRSLPHFSEVDKSSIILCFNSKELIDIEDDDVIMRSLRSLEEKDYELGLFTSKDDYVLKDRTYSLFHYFFFDAKFESNVKSNSLSFLKAHQFLERLIKYHGIIVCYNSVNMQGIDFLVKSGIEYFSADCISQKSTQLLPVDKKIQKKLLNMNK